MQYISQQSIPGSGHDKFVLILNEVKAVNDYVYVDVYVHVHVNVDVILITKRFCAIAVR